MRKIKIAVADDQAMFRRGLVSMLNDIPGVEVVCEASDGKELVNKLRTIKVHIVFLDYRMPKMNGVSAAKTVRENHPDVRILMLSMYDDEEFIISSIENGANGYLTKDDEPEEITRAIESVMNTGYYLNDRTSKLLISKLVHQGKVQPRFLKEDDEEVRFTQQEITVIGLIAKEYSTKEIAQIMNKADRTVEGYRMDIMKKTGTKNSVGIVMYAVKNGIVDANGNIIGALDNI